MFHRRRKKVYSNPVGLVQLFTQVMLNEKSLAQCVDIFNLQFHAEFQHNLQLEKIFDFEF